jgi:hypothetical protein
MNTSLSPQRRRYSSEHQASSGRNNKNTNNMMNEAGNDHHEDCDYRQMASTNANSSSQVVDTIVNAAQVCNSLMSEYCGLCTFYIDKQVQYELISSAAREPAVSFPSGTFDLQSEDYFGVGGRRVAARDVAAAAMMLFDEESVVDSVASR